MQGEETTTNDCKPPKHYFEFYDNSGIILIESEPERLNRNKYKIWYIFYIDTQNIIFYAFL